MIRCIIFLILESILLKSRNNFLKQRVVYLRFYLGISIEWKMYLIQREKV